MNVSAWPAKRWPWLLLAGSALGLELAALYFQYIMKLEPCIMCIYQRVAVFGLLLSGVVGAIAPKWWLCRLAGFAGALTSAVWGLKIAVEHVAMQQNTDPFSFFSCDVVPKFPNFMPLHQWFPAVFEPRGSCDSIDWQFVGLSMPGWMQVVFAVYSALLILVLIARLVKLHKI